MRARRRPRAARARSPGGIFEEFLKFLNFFLKNKGSKIFGDTLSRIVSTGFTVSEPYEEAVERSWKIYGVNPNTISTGYNHLSSKNTYFTVDGTLLLADYGGDKLFLRGEQVSFVTENVNLVIQQDDYLYYSCRDGSNTNVLHSGFARIESVVVNSDSTVIVRFYSESKPTTLGDSQPTSHCTFTTMFEAQNLGEGTMESEVCSRRGTCEEDTGVCVCFKGFVGHDCSRQNSLSI